MKKKETSYLPDKRYLLKMILTMKFIVVLICLTSMQLSANAFAQQLSIRMENATFKEIAREIEKQTGLTFLYSDMKVSNLKKISLDLQKTDVAAVLDKCLQGTDLSFKIVENTVVIIPAETVSVFPQRKMTVKGIVVGEDGTPLPGVTIVIKGTQIGTSSDVQGKFSLDMTDTKDVILVFSFVGMEKKEIPVTDEKELKVVMAESSETIQEVIVTGIFERKKESFTGSATTYSADDLKRVGNQNVLQSLKSLDPAFTLLENNDFGSDPNRLPDIEIRGKSSIVGVKESLAIDPNQPLFILDGFETTLQTIVDLDMERIASITILKDAASTAIYGSKAANGVVVVETKKPEQGELRVTYTGNFNITMPDLSSYNLMNAREKLEFEVLAGRYAVADGSSSDVKDMEELYNQHQKEVARGVDTYWLGEPLRIGFNHRHSLYAEGGDANMRYGAGLSYNGITGVMKESERKVFSGNLDLLYRKNKFQFSNKLTINHTSSGDPVVAFSEYAKANPYYEKKPDGRVEKWLEYKEELIESPNPLWNANLNSRALDRSFGVTNNFSAEYNPLTSLKIRGRFGITKTINESDDFLSPEDTSFDDTEELKKGSLAYQNGKNLQYEGELTVTYGAVLAEKHRLNLVGGGNFSATETETNGYSVIGFPNGNYDTPAFSKGYPENGKPVFSESKSRAMSAYMNGGYAYDNRYLLDLTYRLSGSSVFGTNKRYTNTWSAGLAWNLHNEAFIKGNLDWFDLLKLRASIGNPGNQNFSAYQTYTTYAFSNRQRNYFEPAVLLSGLGNPDLEWQTTMDRNIGMDLAFFGNKVMLNIDYYNKKTDPVLADISIPSSVGVTSVLTNVGEQTSKGLNGTLTVSPIYRPADRVIWSIRYNFRTEKSRYDKIGNKLDKFNENGSNTNLKRYFDGASPDDLYAVRSAGIDPASGNEIFIKKDGTYTLDYSYEDEVKIGVDRPKIEGIFGTSFTYKGFSCNVDFRYRCGGQMFNSALYDKVENISANDLNYNQDKRALYNRWTTPGQQAEYKKISLTSTTPMSSRFVQDDNTLSLESLRVGYEFDSKRISRLGLRSLRLNAYMNDVFKISSIKTERGIEYPFARSVSFSVSASF
nr:SusC/RagA family TonB-linked outer membrane protein [Odoribacter sp. N15.MGS-14]